MRLELSFEEAERLREALESHLTELRWEIANTETLEMRDELKQTRHILEGILSRLVMAPA